ncbi:hypothetical protein A33K_15634 [Burkholderia humptydooensis MSMB43]|uniref:Uncharacterized protein n=1 Tax=Burkholderia humptydooensis MSMB43 TaxID=441157 RepID=A0ABN0G600_9BURK|nr:hypothetical protein A33K_15634 [Burkholderia humptydooensis MSMB43]
MGRTRKVADGNRVVAVSDSLHAERRAINAVRLRVDTDSGRPAACRVRTWAQRRGGNTRRRRQVAKRGGILLRGNRTEADRYGTGAASGGTAILRILRMSACLEQPEIRRRRQHGQPPPRHQRRRSRACPGPRVRGGRRRAPRRCDTLAACPIMLRRCNPGPQCFVPDRLERLVHLVFPRFPCAG